MNRNWFVATTIKLSCCRIIWKLIQCTWHIDESHMSLLWAYYNDDICLKLWHSRMPCAKVGVLRDSHYLFSTPYMIFEWFFGAKKEKKNCASRFEAKKAVMPWEIRDCPWRAASWRHNCTRTSYSSTVLFWLFREINGDKVATGWLFVVFKNQLTWRDWAKFRRIIPTNSHFGIENLVGSSKYTYFRGRWSQGLDGKKLPFSCLTLGRKSKAWYKIQIFAPFYRSRIKINLLGGKP
jgi:hypothetical protein